MASNPLTKSKNRKSAKSSDNNRPVNRLSDAGAEWKEEFGRMVETGKDAVTGLQNDAEQGIRKAPMQSVLVAIGVGALLGLVLGRAAR